MKFQCLTDLVGISNTDCDCVLDVLTTDEIAALRVSKSGLYTDNLEGGVTLKALGDIDTCKLFSEIAIEARNDAITRTEDDLIVALNERYAKNKNRYTGRIGNMAWTKPNQTSRIYVGQRIAPFNKSDAVMMLKGGDISVTTTSDIVIKVIGVPVGASSGTVVAELPVQTIGGSRRTFTFPTGLKLNFSANNQAIEYYVVYDETALNGGQPMNNTISCGCGSEKMLKSFVTTDGVEFNNINELNDKVVNGWANGLVLDVDIKCDNENFICREYDENDAVSITLAYAVLYKAGELIIEGVMKSTEVNRMVLVAREYMWGKRNHFRAEYEARIKWLVSKGIDIDSTDCFVCRQEDGLFYQGIKS